MKLYGLLALCLIAGCSGDKTSGLDGLELTILSGANVTDTISTLPLQGLVVQLSRNGNPEVGAEVRFEGVYDSRDVSLRIAVGNVGSADFSYLASTVTDALGRATVRLRLGELAGPAKVAVSVPLHNLVDTVSYTVLPGNAVRVQLVPHDTVVTAGDVFTYSGSTVDRVGNSRSDPATFQSTGSAAQVTAAGKLTATQVGSSHVRMTATIRGLVDQDSGKVIVAPVGRLASSGGHDAGLLLVDVSGRNHKGLTTPPGAVAPTWAPTGDRIAAAVNGKIIVVDTFGKTTTLTTPSAVQAESPDWSADGSWIYFDDLSSGQVERIHPDGSGLTVIASGSYPSASPDGRSLVYLTKTALVIVDLSDFTSKRTLTSTGPFIMPRWSPDGQWIAFRGVQEAVMLIHPDGTGLHRVGDHGLHSLSWSPDSRFLVGDDSQPAATIVDVASGDMVYLSFLAIQPAWRKR